MSAPLAEALALVERGELAQRCAGVERLARLEGEEATAALVRLLEERSWYLRERVVRALAQRPSAAAAVRSVLREGSWYARASACDVLGAIADETVLPDLVAQIEHRNVSLQKSAVRALRRVAGRSGTRSIAERVAALPRARRRRIAARIAHQEPAWAREVEAALAALPRGAFGGDEEPAPARPAARGGGEGAVLARFRRWLAGLPAGGAGG